MGVLDRQAFEHVFRYEAARAASDERPLVFAVIECPRAPARCGIVLAGTLGPHDLIGHWGDGLVVIFFDADLEQARAALEHAFARVRDSLGVALAGVVRVVREQPVLCLAVAELG